MRTALRANHGGEKKALASRARGGRHAGTGRGGRTQAGGASRTGTRRACPTLGASLPLAPPVPDAAGHRGWGGGNGEGGRGGGRGSRGSTTGRITAARCPQTLSRGTHVVGTQLQEDVDVFLVLEEHLEPNDARVRQGTVNLDLRLELHEQCDELRVPRGQAMRWNQLREGRGRRATPGGFIDARMQHFVGEGFGVLGVPLEPHVTAKKKKLGFP